jgi:hypothetical protein
MRQSHLLSVIALVAAAVLSGCRPNEQVAQNGQVAQNDTRNALTLPSGASVEVTLNSSITSETANVGDPWSGTIRSASVVDGHDMMAVGSSVSGTVTSVTAAHRGNRAMLDLGLASVTVDGRSYHVRGGMESVVAGSPRARNLGAIGAATVAGAVVGHQVGGSDKGTVIGGLIGAATAGAVVSQTSGYQVVLKQGTPLTFTTTQALAVRL